MSVESPIPKNTDLRKLVQVISQAQTSQQPVLKNNSNKKCIVCHKNKAKYTCPKCRKPYCSIQHFRSHNLFCSQDFYERQVNQQLKNTKITDKKQKKKAIQMMNQFYSKLQDQDNPMAEGIVSEEILEGWLRDLQQGKDIQLNKLQQQSFNMFIEKLKTAENQQTIEFQSEKLYWQIQDGLSLYWLDDPQIQQYNQSQHPQIICYRHLVHKRIKEMKQINESQKILKTALDIKQQISSIKKKHKDHIIYCHILQVVKLNVLLLRAFDADYSQIIELFLDIYCHKDNQVLLRNPPQLNLTLDYSQYLDTLMAFINSYIKKICIQINHEKQTDDYQILNYWLTDTKTTQMLYKDSQLIRTNKFILIETLFRLLDSVKSYSQNFNKQKQSLLSLQTMKWSKNIMRNVMCFQKKIQFLIRFMIFDDKDHSLDAMGQQILELYRKYVYKSSHEHEANFENLQTKIDQKINQKKDKKNGLITQL